MKKVSYLRTAVAMVTATIFFAGFAYAAWSEADAGMYEAYRVIANGYTNSRDNIEGNRREAQQKLDLEKAKEGGGSPDEIERLQDEIVDHERHVNYYAEAAQGIINAMNILGELSGLPPVQLRPLPPLPPVNPPIVNPPVVNPPVVNPPVVNPPVVNPPVVNPPVVNPPVVNPPVVNPPVVNPPVVNPPVVNPPVVNPPVVNPPVVNPPVVNPPVVNPPVVNPPVVNPPVVNPPVVNPPVNPPVVQPPAVQPPVGQPLGGGVGGGGGGTGNNNGGMPRNGGVGQGDQPADSPDTPIQGNNGEPYDGPPTDPHKYDSGVIPVGDGSGSYLAQDENGNWVQKDKEGNVINPNPGDSGPSMKGNATATNLNENFVVPLTKPVGCTPITSSSTPLITPIAKIADNSNPIPTDRIFFAPTVFSQTLSTVNSGNSDANISNSWVDPNYVEPQHLVNGNGVPVDAQGNPISTVTSTDAANLDSVAVEQSATLDTIINAGEIITDATGSDITTPTTSDTITADLTSTTPNLASDIATSESATLDAITAGPIEALGSEFETPPCVAAAPEIDGILSGFIQSGHEPLSGDVVNEKLGPDHTFGPAPAQGSFFKPASRGDTLKIQPIPNAKGNKGVIFRKD